MKKHQLFSFLKGAALACLTFAAFSATCFTLTSCGGGGEDGDSTPVTRAGKYFEGKYLTLQAQNVACVVELVEHIKGTNIVRSFISYGHTSPTEGTVFISKATMGKDDVVETAEIKVTTFSGELTEEDEFKRWWAAGTGENAEEKTFMDALTIKLDFDSFSTSMNTGGYSIDMEVEKNGEKKEESMSGDAILSRSPYYQN